MIALTHASTYADVEADEALRRFDGPAGGWLGGAPLGGGRHLLTLEPRGVLEASAESLEVLVRIGPVGSTPVGLIRRIALTVPGAMPEVRCDLELVPCRVYGCRVRLRGTHRPPLLTDYASRTQELVEALAEVLVQHVAQQLASTTLPL